MSQVATWNAEKMLTGAAGEAIDSESEKKFYEGLKRLAEADAVFLAEPFVTHLATSPNLVPDIIGRAAEHADTYGYNLLHANYDDENKQRLNAPTGYDHHMLFFGRKGFTAAETVRLSTRNAVLFDLLDEDTSGSITSLGAHFDDRSELARLDMAQAAVALLDNSPASVIMGDLNSMNSGSHVSKLLNRKLLESLSSQLPSPRAREIGSKLVAMASGQTMEYLHQAGFDEADSCFASTVHHGRIPYGQLDHILGRGVEFEDFKSKRLEGSDHSALIASVKVPY